MSLAHQEPDRVPLDLGGTQTSIHSVAYRALKEYLKLGGNVETQNIVLGLAHVEDAVLQRFDVDLRHVLPGMPEGWTLEFDEEDSFLDEWGVRWQRPPGGYYYDMVEHPLSACTLESLESYIWPNPRDPGRIVGKKQEVMNLRKSTDYALECGLIGLWESAWFIVGLERWLLALYEEAEFVEAVLEGTLLILMEMHTEYLRAVGAHLDLVTLWDDYGSQNGTLISPDMWRKLVKPRMARLIKVIRKETPARIGLHCCGSLTAILDDLVEIGIDVLNPVQVSARGMVPEDLKKRYGKRLTFWGGIDTHHVLPFGSPNDVFSAVKETIAALAPGGGYILASVHNIQPGVPPENIVAMFDTCHEIGHYPLSH
jgi:uroporphyrinogen decarboxylase